MIRPVAFFAFLTFGLSANAQLFFEEAVDIPVFSGSGTELRSAWAGGLNAVQLSVFDADQDGNNDDIFIFDRSGNRVLIFTGEEENGARTYRYTPDYAAAFPYMERWALLRDLNCDGRRDIFTYSPAGGGFATFINTSETSGELAFESDNEFIMSRFQFSTTNSFETNIYVSSLDIPAVLDFDGDGDLDIFTFSVTGVQLEYHENLTVDSLGECGTQLYRAANLCYGQFREGTESNQIFLGQPCSFNVTDPRSADPEGARHVGTTVTAFDADNDGLPDLFLGGVGYNNLTFLKNSIGESGLDSITDYQPDFPAGFGAPAVNIDNFAAAYYEDITGNGIRDLTVGVNEPNTAENTRSVWLYENLGTDSEPVFSLATDRFLQADMIDHGEAAAPVFTDINNDGLPDMVIGTRGAFIENAQFKPSLALYLNTGTAGQPAFTLEDPDWLQVSEIGFGQYVRPTFGDIDGDGDIDLVIGDVSGRVFLLLNTAGPGVPPTYELAGALTADGGVIDVGQAAAPQLFDLDDDGKQDLIIGERNGSIKYYRNSGGAGNFSFTLDSDTLGDISTVEFGFFIGSSTPHFFRHNETTYLLVGVERGRVRLYTDIDGNETGTYTLIDDNAFGIEAGRKAAPFVIDINHDGTPDLFCGSIGGGVMYFAGSPSVSVRTHERPGALLLYPNPAHDLLYTNGDLFRADASYTVYDLSGRAVKTGKLSGHSLRVGELPRGPYILTVSDREGGMHRGLWMRE